MIERIYSRESTIKEQVVIKGDYSEEEALALANAASGEGVSEVARYPQSAHLISMSRPQAAPGFTPAEQPAAAPVEVAAEEAPKQEDSQALSQEAASEPIEVDHVAEAIAEAEAERAAEAAELAVVPIEEAFSGVAPVDNE